MHFHQGPFATESEARRTQRGMELGIRLLCGVRALRTQPERTPDEVPSKLHLRRFFAAPRQLVFDAWTKPEMVKQWWGPNGFTIPFCEIDARAGGEFLIQMKAPDGTVGALKGRYVVFHPPYSFQYIGTPLDKDGNAMCETWTSVFFEEKNGGTEDGS